MVKPSKKFISCACILMLLCLVLAFFAQVREHGMSNSVVHFDQGWSVEYKDSTYQVQEIVRSKLPFKVKYGDTLYFENRLPAVLPEQPVLRFRTLHSAVRVNVNGDDYSYGLDKLERKDFLGSGFHYIVLAPEDAGSLIKLLVVVGEDNAFNTYPRFNFLPAEKAISDFNATHLIEVAVGLFLVLFGILAVLCCLLLAIWNKPMFRLLMIGLLSFLLGLWTLCYMKLMQSFSMDFAFNTLLEFFSLYAGPIPFGLLLIDMYKNSHRRWKVVGLKIFVGLDIAFTLIAAILHGTGLVFCNHLLGYFHVFIMLEFIFLCVFVLPYKKETSLSGKILTWGVAIFAVFAALDLIRYNASKFLLVQNGLLEITLIPVGILVFILLLIASYLNYLRDVIAAKAEKDLLASMVYVDSLTGLFNRAKCGQIFDILSAGKADFAVISLDMNGLKLVNDSYGHAMGDALIKAFGKALKQALSGVGTAIRMGGDEFVAIIRREHLPEIDETLERLKVLLSECPEQLPIRLEAAYGVAIRSECGNGSAEDVYEAADQKMYEMKKNMKSELTRK